MNLEEEMDREERTGAAGEAERIKEPAGKKAARPPRGEKRQKSQPARRGAKRKTHKKLPGEKARGSF